MKVAYVVGGLPFGGVENWLFELASRLKRDKTFDYVVINVSGVGGKAKEFLDAGLNVVNLADSKAALKTHRLDTVLKLRRLLRDLRPDIVHTMHFSGDFFGRLAALGLGAKVVTQLHNIKRETKTHRRLLNKALSYATDAYLSVSDSVAETVAQDHNLAGKPSRTLYIATEPDRFNAPAHDLEAMFGLKGKVVIAVGRYVAQKNFDLLIRAFRLVLDQYPDASLALVGEGPERPKLEGLVQELRLNGRVVLTGYRQDVPSILRAASVLAMPSEYEGLLMAHVEALFCGLPAVLSDRVPSLEVAAEAALVCELTPESVAGQILRLLRDDALHAELSAKALAIAPQFSMAQSVERFAAFYEDLLRGRP